jgi:hypothetical protein
MRRTFQDLAREANIDSIVQRSICGHATQEMSELYSTVGQKEIQRAVGKVISMVGYRELTLGAVAEYARSKQAENGPSEGPDDPPPARPGRAPSDVARPRRRFPRRSTRDLSHRAARGATDPSCYLHGNSR